MSDNPRPDLEYVANREHPRTVELSRDEILLLLAALHKELAHVRSARGADSAAVARANERLGRLIGRLEAADASPMAPGHSADAVPPDHLR